MRIMSLAIAAALAAAGSASAEAPAPPKTPPATRAEVPALGLIIVVDQLASSTLDHFRGKLCDGLKRLLSEGVVFSDARYEAAPTLTGPGHAAISTGVYGAVNGIVSNEWFDREENREVYVVDDPKYRVVGRPPQRRDGTAPTRLRASTLGDEWMEALPGSKVVAVSLKDRSAILLAGHRATAVVWLDVQRGQLSTSDYYGATAPGWTAGINQKLAELRASGLSWARTPASEGLVDDRSFERQLYGQGRTFPHTVAPNVDPFTFSENLMMMPQGDLSILSAAGEAVVGEELGRGDRPPDLLLVSLSGFDRIGHAYGPDSVESLEHLLALDRGIGDLLRFLDTKVGRDRYAVALTADHGSALPPEANQLRGIPAGRVDMFAVGKAAEEAISKALGSRRWVAGFFGAGFYLSAEAREQAARAEELLAAFLARQKGVAAVYRKSQVAFWPRTEVAERYLRAFDARESPDVIVQPEPNWSFFMDESASHGSPYAYDSRVPLVVRLPFCGPREVTRRVEPIDLAPTLARAFRIPSPSVAEGHLLIEAFPTENGPGPLKTARSP